jgi:uncharacterized membrane protein
MTEFVTQHPTFSVFIVVVIYMLVDTVQSSVFNVLLARARKAGTKS